ncbi:MAG: methyltransferase domain-containing protein [Candidatus Altiarchaeota archaeon]
MMASDTVDAKRVLDANREVYDAIADIYEKVDGRRKDELMEWLEFELDSLSKRTSRGRILDFGCGTGFVLKKSKRFFDESYGVDVSFNILKKINVPVNGIVVNDGNPLPFRNESFDVVVFFSVLHHLFDLKPYFREAYRVLKPGGVLYADHDLDNMFYKNFFFPLKAYRMVFNEAKAIQSSKGVSEETFRLSEYHSNGLKKEEVSTTLDDAGFKEVRFSYHWQGLNKILNKVFGGRKFPQGLAPLMSITAVK